MDHAQLVTLLGDKAEYLLGFDQPKISRDRLHIPSATLVTEMFSQSDRSEAVVASLQRLINTGRLAGTGYISILPVDQGIEHTAGASFGPNADYFDPENIVKLALEGGCNAVTSTLGALGMVSKTYADKIPFIVKLNHNELLTYPNKHDQVMFGTAQQAADMGAAGVGATIYFGSPESNRQILEVSQLFAEAHRLGLFTVLWCYPRNKAFSVDGKKYETAVDITAQANHLGVTIEADIIKQKSPTPEHGFADLSFGKSSEQMYGLMSEHPIDLTRFQVANCYMGRVGLINSGGESKGASDLAEAVATAVINKRAGGMGLISGRKAFMKPFEEGVALLNAIQDVYLDQEVTVA